MRASLRTLNYSSFYQRSRNLFTLDFVAWVVIEVPQWKLACNGHRVCVELWMWNDKKLRWNESRGRERGRGMKKRNLYPFQRYHLCFEKFQREYRVHSLRLTIFNLSQYNLISSIAAACFVRNSDWALHFFDAFSICISSSLILYVCILYVYNASHTFFSRSLWI